MKIVIITLCIYFSLVELSILLIDPWNAHKLRHGLKFDKVEDSKRKDIFLRNMKYIEKINAAGLSYKLEMNHLGHLTIDELTMGINKKYFKEKSKTINRLQSNYGIVENNEDYINSKMVDWRKVDAVSPVRDQGKCGSCWSFSAVGAIESAIMIKYRKSKLLSEQQLVDCDKSTINEGCNGGITIFAFEYAREVGLYTEQEYYYRARNGKCKIKKKSFNNYNVTKIKGYVILESNENVLTKAIHDIGPISVDINVNSTKFQFYKSGIFYDQDCKADFYSLNHAVLAVGYGYDDILQKPYYIIKNSWGKDWGDHGYIKVIRNSNYNCGIALSASYPVV